MAEQHTNNIQNNKTNQQPERDSTLEGKVKFASSDNQLTADD